MLLPHQRDKTLGGIDMRINFEYYGLLEFIDAEEFYKLNASIFDEAVGDDGEKYTIILVRNEDNSQTLVCGWI